MMVCTAQLEPFVRIQWLAPSSVLDRLHDDTLLIGFWPQEEASKSNKGNTLWDDWLKVFHLSKMIRDKCY